MATQDAGDGPGGCAQAAGGAVEAPAAALTPTVGVTLLELRRSDPHAPGYEFSLFQNKATKKRCFAGPGLKRGKTERVSRLHLLEQHRGTFRDFTDAEISAWGGDPKSKAAVADENRKAMFGFMTKKSGASYNYWVCVENWVLLEHADSTYADIVRGWETGVGDFVPLPIGILIHMLRSYWIDPRLEAGASGEEARGRGGYPVCKSITHAINSVHGLAGMKDASPVLDALATTFLSFARGQHLTVSHKGIDVVDDIPKFYEACMSMPTWSSLDKMQTWSMLMLAFDHFHRESESAPRNTRLLWAFGLLGLCCQGVP
jgi:hypothetical protein